MSSFIVMPKSQKGQGLFIYVMFLLFVVMVVIVVMRLVHVGPAETAGGYEADYRYWNDPANGCIMDYAYGTNSGCDSIIEKVQACLNGDKGSYCEEYFSEPIN